MKSQQFLLVLAIFILGGCKKPIPLSAVWNGTLTIAEHKQLPFQMVLDLNSSPATGYFLNGTEQTQIPEIQHNDDSLSFIFSEYGAAMHGLWNGRQWQGKFFRYRSDTSWNEFSASAQDNFPHQESTTSSNITLTGKYQAYIPSKEGIDSTTGANFWIKNNNVHGTLIAPDGDYGLLVGSQNGSKVTLARFTGWQTFVLELEQQGNGWNGKLYARNGKPMALSLSPLQPKRTLLKSEQQTTIKNPKAQFTFDGTTSTGEIVRSTDDRFKGKALLLDIMGTWCHNCMDAAPLLQQLYAEYKEKELEVVGLSFEISDNPELAKKNLTLFQKRYGITYPVLFCGSTKAENVNAKLHSQLNNFSGYPTTIFIDKNRSVKTIHLGFNGPGTGEEYQQQIQQYHEIIKGLLK